MVRPRHRGNRLLHLPGISADPRARALAATLVVTPRAHSEGRTPLLPPRHRVAQPSSICFLCSSFHCASPFYLLPMSHCIARPSSICLLLMSLGCLHLRILHLSPTRTSLYCASLIYLFSYVRHSVARLFLSPTLASLSCASFVCLSCAPFCLVVNRGCRGEERVSDSLAS
jgi:hypothetical protein